MEGNGMQAMLKWYAGLSAERRELAHAQSRALVDTNVASTFRDGLMMVYEIWTRRYPVK